MASLKLTVSLVIERVRWFETIPEWFERLDIRVELRSCRVGLIFGLCMQVGKIAEYPA